MIRCGDDRSVFDGAEVQIATVNVDGVTRYWGADNINDFYDMWWGSDYDGPAGDDRILELTVDTLNITGVETFGDFIKMHNLDKNPEDRLANIQKLLYEDYKTEWLKEHVTDGEWEDLYNSYQEGDIRERYPNMLSYAEEAGFAGGAIYACFEEFLENEYLDPDWMNGRLNKADKAFMEAYNGLGDTL